MIIGVPKEIKTHEYRVALTPANVKTLVADGHSVLCEPSLGQGSGFTDSQYEEAGGRLAGKEELFGAAELIVKVKEPEPGEFGFFREGQSVFTFLHLAPDRALTEMLLEKELAGFAYETLEHNGGLPLLTPMSEIAGRMSTIMAAFSVELLRKELQELRKKIKSEGESEVVLIHCLLFEKNHYHRLFMERMLSEANLKELERDIDKQFDRLKEGKDVYVDVSTPLLERTVKALEKVPWLRSIIRKGDEDMIERHYDMERVRLTTSARVLKELKKLKRHETLSDSAIERSVKIYNSIHDRSVFRMEAIRNEYPEYVEKAEKNILERFCLKSELESYRELYSKGSITEKILGEMEEKIGERLRKI